MKTINPLKTALAFGVGMLLLAAGPSAVAQDAAHTASATVELSVQITAENEDVQVIEISVSPGGYDPSEIELAAGVTTHLVFTRTAEGGCVGQVQIPDLGIEKTDLPLGEAVTIEVTPAEAGTFRFACGMNMVRGTILVRE